MNRLEMIIDNLNEAIKCQYQEHPDNNYVETCITHKYYDIDVTIDSMGGIEVSIVNAEYVDRNYSNAEDYIANNIIKWDDLGSDDDDDWDCNGFSSEADYMKYKFG